MPWATEFTVTEEHIKLLRRAYVRWEDCEFGAPSIDCKRPYGNSNVLYDIAEILGYPIDEDGWDWPDRELSEKLHQLHKDTEIVLQIFLEYGQMLPGKYINDSYGRKWKRVEDA